MIDIKKLSQLSWLQIDPNDDKTIAKLEWVIWYLDLLRKAKLDESNNISNIYNKSDRNSGVEDFANKAWIIDNIDHKIINNSAVVNFGQ